MKTSVLRGLAALFLGLGLTVHSVATTVTPNTPLSFGGFVSEPITPDYLVRLQLGDRPFAEFDANSTTGVTVPNLPYNMAATFSGNTVTITSGFGWSANPALLVLETDGTQPAGAANAWFVPIPFVHISTSNPLVATGFFPESSIARARIFIGAGFNTPDGGSTVAMMLAAVVVVLVLHRRITLLPRGR